MRQFSKFLVSLEKEEYKKKYAVPEVKLVGLPKHHYPNTFKTFLQVGGIVSVVLSILTISYIILRQEFIASGEGYVITWITISLILIMIFAISHYFSVKTELQDEQIIYRKSILQQRAIFLQNLTFYQRQEKLFKKKNIDGEGDQKFQAISETPDANNFDDFLKVKKEEKKLKKKLQKDRSHKNRKFKRKEENIIA